MFLWLPQLPCGFLHWLVVNNPPESEHVLRQEEMGRLQCVRCELVTANHSVFRWLTALGRGSLFRQELAHLLLFPLALDTAKALP